MPDFPRFPYRTALKLDGVWDFSFLGDVDADALGVAEIRFDDRMAVPMAYDATPRYAGKRGLAAYRTEVDITPGKVGHLLIGGFGIWLRVCVDGKRLGTYPLPYSPVDVVLPPSSQTKHKIVLLVDNRFDDERSPLQRQYFDFYAYGGVFRSVQLHEVDPTWLGRVRVQPLDLEGRVRLTARLHHAVGKAPEELNLTYAFDDAPRRETAVRPVWDGGVAEVAWEASVPEPRLWSPDAPHLHQVEVRWDSEESAVVERFGIRTVEARGQELYLNGKPLRLRGYNRHESHPQTGPALPPALHLSDLQILKDMGANCVRGSHYSQDQQFLELCDELGFVVWEESLAWQQDTAQLSNQRFVDLQVEQTERMMRESFNHPSIILWGILNEGESHQAATRPAYRRLLESMRQLDGSRLVTYATNHLYQDRHLDLVDVVCVNSYPGWYAKGDQARPIEEIDGEIERIAQHLDEVAPDKPALISEIGAGALYGFRDAHRAHWSEEYQADLLERVCDVVLRHPRLMGLLIWQMYDTRTFDNSHALSRPRGFNNKGTFDEYRRPKLAHAVVKKRFWDDSALKPGGPVVPRAPGRHTSRPIIKN